MTKLSENAVVNQLIKLVESAQSKRAPIQLIADRIAKWFVPGIVMLAVFDWIVWFTIAYTNKDAIAKDLVDRT